MHEQASTTGGNQPPTLDLISIVSIEQLRKIGEEMKNGAKLCEDQNKYAANEEELKERFLSMTNADHRQMIEQSRRKLILLGDSVFNLVMTKSDLGKEYHLSVSQPHTIFKNGQLSEVQGPIGPPNEVKLKPVLDTFFSSWEKVYVPSVMFIITHFVGDE